MSWKNVTDVFSESERHYNGKYLEICEVYDNLVEVNLFSSQDDLDEIYMSFGRFYGIVYVEREKAAALRDEIKKVLIEEYKVNKEPSGEFINSFANKYKVCIPNDMFFDFKFY